MRKRAAFKSIGTDKRGISAVEFGLICLPMFTLIMGAIEAGVLIYQKAHAEGVLREAARLAVTGDVARIGEDGAKLDAFVREQLKFTQSTQVDIAKSFYDDFSQVKQPEKRLSNATEAPYCFIDTNGNQKWDLDPSQTGIGGAEDIIDYHVTVTYDPLFPLVSRLFTDTGKISVSAQTTLRNEPFAGDIDQQPQTCCVAADAAATVTCSD